MAESVMESRVAGHEALSGRVVVASAGTGGWHVGEPADPRTGAVLRAAGYRTRHCARQIHSSDLDSYNLLVAMDSANLRNLRRLAEDQDDSRIVLLRSFDPAAATGAEVPDPYGGGAQEFTEVLAMVESACDGLVEWLAGRLLP